MHLFFWGKIIYMEITQPFLIFLESFECTLLSIKQKNKVNKKKFRGSPNILVVRIPWMSYMLFI